MGRLSLSLTLSLSSYLSLSLLPYIKEANSAYIWAISVFEHKVQLGMGRFQGVQFVH